jgi:LysR family pca operon transcriptional activator
VRRYLSQQLKLRLLRVMATVAAEGSLLKAAQALGLTQPALTKNLRELEDIVGARLFVRHSRGVSANAQGQLLADASRKILTILRETEDSLERLEIHTDGTVAVGVLPTAASWVAPQLLRRMKQRYPGVHLRVIENRSEELRNALDLGEIDFVIGRLYLPLDDHPRIEQMPLYDEPMAFVVGRQHPLADKQCIEASELLNYPWSLPAPTLRVGIDTHAFLQALGVSRQEEFTNTSLAMLRELLLDSELVTVVPTLAFRGDIERGTLKTLMPVDAARPPARTAGLLLRRGHPLSAAAQRLISVFSEYARDDLPQHSQ